MDILNTIIIDGLVYIKWRNFLFNAAIGRNGIIDAAEKKEGDGKTPKGIYKITHGYYRPDRLSPPKTALTLFPMQPSFGWCDDPIHCMYNQKINKPFEASHEDLWRDDHLYDLILVIDHNAKPIVSGQGSAIFIHIAPTNFTPSSGCLTLKREDLLAIVETCSFELFWEI